MVPQERILDELGTEMDSTSNRLDFVQVSIYLLLVEIWQLQVHAVFITYKFI